jgi:hypothetical protein
MPSSPLRPALLLAAGLGGLLVAALPPRVLAASANPGGSTSPSIGEALKPSSTEQIAVADWLRQRGVIFYGAWWCPACFQQKNLFGKEAGNRLPYVECDKEEAGRQRCAAAEVRAFPTWVLGGERREGVQTLEELKGWSGFPGAAPASSPRPAAP